jgi:tetratricopeptide (TPR) repeat protein
VPEGGRWCAAALRLPGGTTAQRALTMGWHMWFSAQEHEIVPALAELAAARELAERSADPYVIGMVSLLSANVLDDTGRRSDAQVALARAEEMFAETGDEWGLGLGSLLRALDRLKDGERDRSMSYFDTALEVMSENGDPWAQGLTLATRAGLHEAAGDYAAARADLRRARRHFEEVGSRGFEMVALASLGNLAVLEGDLDEADRLHREAVGVMSDGLVGELKGQILMARAFSHRRRGELDAAAAVLDEALTLRRVKQIDMGLAFGSTSRGFVAELQGDAEAAERYHLEGLRAAAASDDRRAVALAFEGLAGVARLRGDDDRATGGPLPPGERADVDRIEAAAVAGIGRDAFAAAHGRGGRAPLDGLLHGLLAEPEPTAG